jgi:hypothetical protein
MRKIRSTAVAAVSCVATAAVLALTATPAQAYATSCINGSSTSSYYHPSGGDVNPHINENTAWRYRAMRTDNYGQMYVGFFSGDGASGLIAQYSNVANNGAPVWIGRWSSNLPTLANSIKVTNYGPGTNVDYNRSCTKV